MPFNSKDTIIKSYYTPFVQCNKQGVTSPIAKNNIELFNFENKNNDGLVIEHINKKKSEPTKQSKTNTLQKRIAKIEQELKKAENSNGILGKAWSWFKNKTDKFLPVDSSNKVRKQLEIEKQKIKDIKNPEIFKELTGVEYSEENYAKFEQGKIKLLSEQKLEGYKEGQDMVVDVVADVGAGITAGVAIAAAPVTGGTSLLLAAGVGGVTKIGIKGTSAGVRGKDYSGKDILKDLGTGAITGLLTPITIGVGGAVGNVSTRIGARIFGQSAAGEIATKATTFVLREGSIGAVFSGGAEGLGDVVRQGYHAVVDGEDFDFSKIYDKTKEAAKGGFITGVAMSGMIRSASKTGTVLNNKITMSKVLPDGIKTKFRQGEVGDCPLLSIIDGMMSNPNIKNKIKKSITKTISGDYNVKIGNTIVKVTKSELSEDILTDVTGIKLFEIAFKKLQGSLDGGFAEVVAKHFGLNPVHISREAITDELLNNLAKNKNNAVLSLGALVDSNGTITKSSGFRHYFTIKDIDANSRMLTLTSPKDTSQPIKLTYDEVKNLGISIDGGTTTKIINIPNVKRNIDETAFGGKTATKTKGLINQVYIERLIKDGKIKEGISVLEDGTIVINNTRARGEAYYAIFKPNSDNNGGYWFDSRYLTDGYGYIETNTAVKDLYFSQLDISLDGRKIVTSMKQNGFKGEVLHATRITIDGKEYIFCYDNRRLSAAIQCKIEKLPVVIHEATDIFRKGDTGCTQTWGNKIIERLKNFGKGTIIQSTGSSKKPIYIMSRGVPIETFYEMPRYRKIGKHGQPKPRNKYKTSL